MKKTVGQKSAWVWITAGIGLWACEGGDSGGDGKADGGGNDFKVPSCSISNQVVEVALPESSTEGRLSGASRNPSTTCTRGTGTGGPEQIFALVVRETQVVEVQVRSEINTTVAIRKACDDPLSEVACSDEPGASGGGGIGGAAGSFMGGFGGATGGAFGRPGPMPPIAFDAGVAPEFPGAPVTDAGVSDPIDPGQPVPVDPAPPEPPLTSDNFLDGGLRVVLEPGVYFILVDEAEAFGVGGDFVLDVRARPLPAQSRCAGAPRVADGQQIVADLDLARAAAPSCSGLVGENALYYAVTIPSGHTLTAHASALGGRNPFEPVLQLLSGCGEGACLAGDVASALGGRQVEYVNNAPGPITLKLSVAPSAPTAGGRIGLSVRIRQPAPNATCAAAIPISTSTIFQNLDASGSAPFFEQFCGIGQAQALFYKVTLQPGQRVTALVTARPPFFVSAGVFVREGCAGQCLFGFSNFVDFRNNTAAAKTVILGAGHPASEQASRFDLSIQLADPPANLFAKPGQITTSENGAKVSFRVGLTAAPTAAVMVPLASSDATEGTVFPAALVFTPADWNMPREVTVTGVDDNDRDGLVVYAIKIGPASSADARYQGKTVADLMLENLDDEPGVVLRGAVNLQTSELGAGASFTVALQSQPAADVILRPRSSNPSEGRVTPAALTFTPTNFSQPQTVIITGVADAVADGEQKFNVVLGPAESTDPNYAGFVIAPVVVTNIEFELLSTLHFSFDEQDRALVTDSSGRGNHGEVVSGASLMGGRVSPWNASPGKHGQGIELQSGQFIAVKDSDSLDATGLNNAVSLSAWVRSDKTAPGAAPTRTVIARHEIGTRLIQFSLALVKGVPTAGVHFFFTSAPVALPEDGQWHHLATTYDGVTLRLFVDGAEAGFSDLGWPIAPDETALLVGARQAEETVVDPWNGGIDEVWVFDRMLDTRELGFLSGTR